MTKMTYVAALNYVLTNVADLPADVTERLTALRDQTEKRNSADRKPTKKQTEAEGLKEIVLEALSAECVTVSELMAKDERLSELSNQKVSALVNALVRDGKAIKVPDGRKSTFCKA